MAVRNLASLSTTMIASSLLHSAIVRGAVPLADEDLLTPKNFRKTPPTQRSTYTAPQQQQQQQPQASSNPDSQPSSQASSYNNSSSKASASGCTEASIGQSKAMVCLLHTLLAQEASLREALAEQEASLGLRVSCSGSAAAEGFAQESEEVTVESTRIAQAEALADCGAEMDPLSNELDLEVKGLRMGLLQAVEEHAQVAARLEDAGLPMANIDSIAPTLRELQSLHPGTDWVAASRQLQALWNLKAYENMHLQVRIAQLRQLPGQPKRKITLAAVREQQTDALFFSRSMLMQRTSEMAAQLRGM